MSTTNAYLTVRGIEVEINYKAIKNLHIGVYPPLGKVRVSSPLRLSIDQIRLAVIQRLPWIKRHQQELRNAARQTPRDMVTGESHYLWGVRYRLKVIERPGHSALAVNGSRLELCVPPNTPTDTRIRALQTWQRQELRKHIQPLVTKWQSVIGEDVPYWNIRRMKTKWGSCNPHTGRVWFNLELVTKDPRCLEYVVVHELTHLRERRHDARFVELMDKLLPDWRQRRDELNGAPLAYEEWDAR